MRGFLEDWTVEYVSSHLTLYNMAFGKGSRPFHSAQHLAYARTPKGEPERPPSPNSSSV